MEATVLEDRLRQLQNGVEPSGPGGLSHQLRAAEDSPVTRGRAFLDHQGHLIPILCSWRGPKACLKAQRGCIGLALPLLTVIKTLPSTNPPSIRGVSLLLKRLRRGKYVCGMADMMGLVLIRQACGVLHL